MKPHKKAYFLIILLVLAFNMPNFAEGNAEIGIYLGTPLPTKDALINFESSIGKDISSVLFYQGWNSGYAPAFPLQYLNDNVRDHEGASTNTSLQVTLEPYVNLSNIINGSYDNYLKNYAAAMKQWGTEVRFRFAHEMIQDDNPATGGWYPWQDNPADYTAAFQHIHDIVINEVGANNVKFVWSPNHHLSDPAILEKYYPGDQYVDWIGLDGYNWGYATASEPWGYWASFDDIFYDIYQSIIQNPQIFGIKPMMIGEFASAEGTLKDEWILDAFQKIKDEYAQLEAFYWFNSNKERQWFADSSAESLAAFMQAVSDAYFTSHSAGVPFPNNQVDPSNIPITLNIPSVSMLNVGIARIVNSSWENATEIGFGTLNYDSQFSIFRSNAYYALDIGIISNQPPWVITHNISSITNGADNLDDNFNVIFVKQNAASSSELGKYSFKDSNGASFNNSVIDSTSWLRIYYGVATGVNDAPGVTPVTIEKSPGVYTGSITITLTNL
ncbi:MAG: hypothetical protein COV72_00250 [Candidatus Omnitrophica bacterium CG11_big_fil_rev_8_21_14_0_20_42_13]|uniref:GH26 domain-containing protein n=1 Tax=Candidatus Ghiorseimicrobium undicola TaxID=1974746 RepID=A0A2H0M015_9BACT|nr:MAG: hypothetical protein COV72_00250 [Candidatus Omnitrophica bacterium CG11_big_fil_rev_8_21_14_0_20_42_13]